MVPRGPALSRLSLCLPSADGPGQAARRGKGGCFESGVRKVRLGGVLDTHVHGAEPRRCCAWPRAQCPGAPQDQGPFKQPWFSERGGVGEGGVCHNRTTVWGLRAAGACVQGEKGGEV